MLRGCTASAQGKAATVQGGGPNWSWGKIILCPTIEVLGHENFGVAEWGWVFAQGGSSGPFLDDL
jgi:hypothetical protein